MGQAFDLIIHHTTISRKNLVEEVLLKDCLNHVLAEDVYAKDDLPPFRASVMDGYAINFE